MNEHSEPCDLLQTFTTQETITNATSAKMWLLDKLHDVSVFDRCFHSRAKYFTVSSLKDLFYHVNADIIVDFIKDIGFYNHL